MRFSQKIIVFLFTFLFIHTVAAAETMYVSDQLLITFRQGKSTEHKILKTLKTGMPLEILEREEGDNYVKVKLQSGEEGYVLSQYLTNETPKSILISRLEKQLEKIREQLAQANAKRAETSQQLNAVQEQQTLKEGELTGSINELNLVLAETKKDLQAATVKYNTLVENSGKVVEITTDRDRLKKTNEKLSSKVQSLTAENSELLRTGMIKWFLAGGGVLFFGWIIGRISRKKRSRF
ncbi:MAG: TIGR04211 family SH3 domain-containing protein [Thermodesulfobacteriota bacterium]